MNSLSDRTYPSKIKDDQALSSYDFVTALHYNPLSANGVRHGETYGGLRVYFLYSKLTVKTLVMMTYSNDCLRLVPPLGTTFCL